jgi:hypothetical protein
MQLPYPKFWTIICAASLLLAWSACNGPRKAAVIAQSHPDSLAHAFVRICRKADWGALHTLAPTLKEQKAIFGTLKSPADEPRPQPTFHASERALADSITAQAVRVLDKPLLQWATVRLEQVRPSGSPEELGGAVKIRRHVLRLRFTHGTFLETLTVWEWEGRFLLADFSAPAPITGP